MTEAIIITAIIVGGIVALAWVLLHFAFRAWQTEKILAHDNKPLTTEVHISNPASAEQAAAQAYERVRRFDLS